MTTTTSAQLHPLQSHDQVQPTLVKIGEWSAAYLRAPSGITEEVDGVPRVLTNRQALEREVREELGGQAVHFTMNGHNSAEANAWNSEVTRFREANPTAANAVIDDYVYSLTALVPAAKADGLTHVEPHA
jgi:hypothetical protein